MKENWNLKLFFFSGCVHVFEEGYNFCVKVHQIFIQKTIKVLLRKKYYLEISHTRYIKIAY